MLFINDENEQTAVAGEEMRVGGEMETRRGAHERMHEHTCRFSTETRRWLQSSVGLALATWHGLLEMLADGSFGGTAARSEGGST